MECGVSWWGKGMLSAICFGFLKSRPFYQETLWRHHQTPGLGSWCSDWMWVWKVFLQRVGEIQFVRALEKVGVYVYVRMQTSGDRGAGDRQCSHNPMSPTVPLHEASSAQQLLGCVLWHFWAGKCAVHASSTLSPCHIAGQGACSKRGQMATGSLLRQSEK